MPACWSEEVSKRKRNDAGAVSIEFGSGQKKRVQERRSTQVERIPIAVTAHIAGPGQMTPEH